MDNLKIGKFLLDLREEKHLTQTELGEIIGVSNRAVSKWETGEGLPNYDAMLALSNLYGVTINEIIEGKRAEKKKEVEKSPYRWAYILLSILAICFLTLGIFWFILLNAVGSVLIGTLIILISVVVGGGCHAATFAFKDEVRGLKVVNNVLSYIAVSYLVFGASALGYLELPSYISYSWDTVLRYSLMVIAPPAVFLGIFTNKATEKGLSFNCFVTEYGNKLCGIWAIGEGAFYLLFGIIQIANRSTGWGDALPYIWPFIPAVIGLVLGGFSLKNKVCAIVGSSLLTIVGIVYFALSIRTVSIPVPDAYVPATIYDEDAVCLFLNGIVYTVFSSLSLAFWKTRKPNWRSV